MDGGAPEPASPSPAGAEKGSRRLSAGLAAVAAVYPLLVYLGLRAGIPMRFLALFLLTLLALRWGRTAARRLPAPALAAAASGALALAWVWSEAAVRFYPAAVNATLLLLFALSLRLPPSAVERLARLRNPGLDARGVAYTRKVTWVWCFFFAGNGLASLATALWSDDAGWAFYNGFFAYVLMGALFCGEWLVRRSVLAAKQPGELAA